MKIFKRIVTTIITFVSACCFVSCNLSTEKQVSVVGTYTGSWTFTEDGKVSHDPDPYDYASETLNGTYTQTGNEVSITWESGKTLAASCDGEGRLVVSEKTYTKVDMETLYQDFAGVYNNYEAMWPSDAVHSMNFTANGELIPGNLGAFANYSLEPITQTHGKVHTEVLTVAGIGYLLEGEPIGYIFYTKIGDKYHLRLSEGAHRYNPWGVAHNHFIDWKQRGDTYDTEDLFETLAGAGGTEEAPVSKTYTDGAASLTLKNDGKLQLERADASGAVTSSKTFLGGKAVFSDGATEQEATYNMIALDESSGKIFIDMAAIPVIYYTAYIGKTIDPARWVVGDYKINGGSITVSFTYLGQSYTLTNEN
ncbi:MAG: hypothetical protein IJX96_02170 [Clostridia bacterium]|nr:hypothetical protein [Clostridia bacterium]